MPNSLADAVSEKAEALVGAPDDFNSVIDLIGDARFVLIGEASHGTQSFIESALKSRKSWLLNAASTQWPWRRIGRMHIASIVSCAARAGTPTAWKP
jgi:hypothetical protein